MKPFASRCPGLASFSLLALVACDSDRPQPVDGAVTDSAYVEVMVELLLLESRIGRQEAESVPPEGADSVRTEILRNHGLTAAEVMQFADSVGTDAARMEGLWEQIASRYDSLRSAENRRAREARAEREARDGSRAAGVDSLASPGSHAAGDSILRSELRSLRRQRMMPAALFGGGEGPRRRPALRPGAVLPLSPTDAGDVEES